MLGEWPVVFKIVRPTLLDPSLSRLSRTASEADVWISEWVRLNGMFAVVDVSAVRMAFGKHLDLRSELRCPPEQNELNLFALCFLDSTIVDPRADELATREIFTRDYVLGLLRLNHKTVAVHVVVWGELDHPTPVSEYLIAIHVLSTRSPTAILGQSRQRSHFLVELGQANRSEHGVRTGA
jgi:hypothetical protein